MRLPAWDLRTWILVGVGVVVLTVGFVLARLDGGDEDVATTDETLSTTIDGDTSRSDDRDDRDDDPPTPEPTTTTTGSDTTGEASTTTSPATSTTTTSTTVAAPATTSTAAPPPLDTEAVLLDLDDLPDGWTAGDEALTNVGPEEAFCGSDVTVTDVERFSVAAFEEDADGPFVVVAAVSFASGGQADDYLDAIARTTECETWTDDNGFVNTVNRLRAGTAAARSDGYRQTVDTGDFSFVSDIVYLRSGRGVAIAIHVDVDETDPERTGDVWNRQADRLIQVVSESP